MTIVYFLFVVFYAHKEKKDTCFHNHLVAFPIRITIIFPMLTRSHQAVSGVFGSKSRCRMKDKFLKWNCSTWYFSPKIISFLKETDFVNSYFRSWWGKSWIYATTSWKNQSRYMLRKLFQLPITVILLYINSAICCQIWSFFCFNQHHLLPNLIIFLYHSVPKLPKSAKISTVSSLFCVQGLNLPNLTVILFRTAPSVIKSDHFQPDLFRGEGLWEQVELLRLLVVGTHGHHHGGIRGQDSSHCSRPGSHISEL